ncbi:MAG TPA: membrane dipeptidase [Planctomycetota bacterium]|jgi:membrane dipeptidase|nr:membrane dipeptidase [Planctomycetota bacterium]
MNTAVPVFDAHVDSLQLELDLAQDLGLRSDGHLDLVRGRSGGLATAVFVSWVDPKHLARDAAGARARASALLGAFHALAQRHPDRLRFAGNAEMLDAAHAAGAIAGIPGIEGGHAIEEDLDVLHAFFVDGIRVLTLVWNNHLSWIRSCRDGAGAAIPEGLSAFGRKVVRAMNDLGMVVDLSHAGERSFYDALDASSAPPIASHSACHALHGHPRNLTDDQLRALGSAGGVVGIPFCVAFLSRAAQEEDARLRETPAYRAIEARNDTELSLLQGRFLQREASPLPIDCVVEHVVHAVEIAGVDHVGLGSDYDGIGRTPQGLEDASCYGRLGDALRATGFGSDDVAKIMGGNMRRVFARTTGPGTLAHATAAPTHRKTGIR